mmetsp:Transcript_14638/g.30936  ORF Transcript_14638/g.30936 Transcript_14638/m.30936 type:complete len:238 (-) Transcript_14638:385-1098(-)
MAAHLEKLDAQRLRQLRLEVEPDQLRLVQTRAREVRKHRRHRGGEKQRLSRRRHAGEDGVQLRCKSHLEEPVGLIKNDVLNSAKRELRIEKDVLQPSGRGDDDVRVCRESVELVLHRVAANEQAEAQRRADEVRELAAEFVCLDCELARGREDGGADADGGRVALETVEERQQKRGGLPGACSRHGDDVLAGEDGGNRSTLDGRRHAVALAHHRFVNRWAQPHGLEAAAALLLDGRL